MAAMFKDGSKKGNKLRFWNVHHSFYDISDSGN